MVYLGIDIGGTSVKYGWGDPDNGLACFAGIEIRNGTVQELTSHIQTVLETAEARVGLDNIAGIGLGTAGLLDLRSGKLVGVNPNLKSWIDLDPADFFPVRYRDKIKVENDANLMALAEAYQAPAAHSVIGITIGSGIGCGLVLNGKIFRGAHGYAMELGHNTVCLRGEPCNCGRNGCLEAYASLRGLQNRVVSTSSGYRVTGYGDIIILAEKDRQVKKYFNEAITYLATAIANLEINLDPDLIVIGGGAVEVSGYPLTDLLTKIQDCLPAHLKSVNNIKKAVYGRKAGVMGAIILAHQEIAR